MNAQLHTIFTGLAIVVLGIGAFLRLRRHPLYTNELLLNGLFYAVWSGLIAAWLPNFVPPVLALLTGDSPPSGWWLGGLDNWMLGVAGGLVAAYFYIRANNLPLLFILDAIAPVLPLTLVVVRIGCAIHGDAYGKVTDSWVAMWLPDLNGTYAWRYPTQYVSMAANLLICLVLVGVERFGSTLDVSRKWIFPGSLFLLYVLLYSVQRFFFEFWRGDKVLIAGPFMMTHLYCVIAISLVIVSGWRLMRTQTLPAFQATQVGQSESTERN